MGLREVICAKLHIDNLVRYGDVDGDKELVIVHLSHKFEGYLAKIRTNPHIDALCITCRYGERAVVAEVLQTVLALYRSEFLEEYITNAKLFFACGENKVLQLKVNSAVAIVIDCNGSLLRL